MSVSGDAPSHTSTVPDSTSPLGWNSTPLCFLSQNSTPISKLCSALKLELHSTYTSGVTVDVKWLTYVHPGSVRGLCSAGSVHALSNDPECSWV